MNKHERLRRAQRACNIAASKMIDEMPVAPKRKVWGAPKLTLIQGAAMDKPRYRYNNKTGKWDQVARPSNREIVEDYYAGFSLDRFSLEVPK